MDAIEVSYDNAYDDYEVCVVTLDAAHEESLLAVCLGKMRTLADPMEKEK